MESQEQQQQPQDQGQQSKQENVEINGGLIFHQQKSEIALNIPQYPFVLKDSRSGNYKDELQESQQQSDEIDEDGDFHFINNRISGVIQQQIKQEQQQQQQMDYDKVINKFTCSNYHKNQNIKKTRNQITQKKLVQLVKIFTQYQQNKQLKTGRKKLTLHRIAIMFNFGLSTIKSLYNDYHFDKTLINRIAKVRADKRQKNYQILTARRIQAVRKLLEENPFFTQTQMLNRLNLDDSLKKKGKQIKLSIVSRCLQLMNYSKKKIVKVPQFRNTPQNIQRRFEYCQVYKKLMDQNRRVYFLDESAFNLFTVRNTAWSVKGKPLQHRVKFPRGKNVSLIAIMSETGIVAWQVKNGNFRKQHHLNFIQKFFTKLSLDKKTHKEYLIMDNCKIHDRHQAVTIGQKCNVEIMFLPPYSPMLNPIENWFNQLKCKVRKAIINTQQQLTNEIGTCVESYQNYKFDNYYRNAMSHVMKGLLKQDF